MQLPLGSLTINSLRNRQRRIAEMQGTLILLITDGVNVSQ